MNSIIIRFRQRASYFEGSILVFRWQ